MSKDLNNKLMRCPRLGHELTFSYCRKESGYLPCSRIVHCWSSVFDIEALLRKDLLPDLWQKFVNSEPKDKVINIIELIAAAKAKSHGYEP
jgi:hypothetical protein